MSQDVDELRGKVQDLRQDLEESQAREQQTRNELLTVQQELEQAKAQLAELKRFNNASEDEKHGIDAELSELKLFAAYIARDVGLNPADQTITLALIRDTIKKKTSQTCHEEMAGPLIAKVRRVLDPSNQYESILDAAKAVMRLSGQAEESRGDMREVLAELEREKTLRINAEHQEKSLRDQLLARGDSPAEKLPAAVRAMQAVAELADENKTVKGALKSLLSGIQVAQGVDLEAQEEPVGPPPGVA